MNRLRTLVVVLGVVLVGLIVVLTVLLVTRGPGTSLVTTGSPGETLSQRTLVAVVAILAGAGCLVLMAVGLAVAFIWSRRAGAPTRSQSRRG